MRNTAEMGAELEAARATSWLVLAMRTLPRWHHGSTAGSRRLRPHEQARGYCCEVPGCGATRGLEIDHIDDWHSTFRTELARLCWLCRRHHLDKTHRGWRLEGPPGDRRWVTPWSQAGPDPPGDTSAA